MIIHSLFVHLTNLSLFCGAGTTADDLYPLFAKYGKVVDIFIPRDRRTGDSRGFAFVRYKYADEAQRAVEKLDGKNVDGRDIMVQFAKYGPNAEPMIFSLNNPKVESLNKHTKRGGEIRSELESGSLQDQLILGLDSQRKGCRVSSKDKKEVKKSEREKLHGVLRYRDDYRGRDYRRRSRSRSRDRYDRDRYYDRERDYRHRSRSRSLSPDYHKSRSRRRYDDERRSSSRSVDSASPRSHSPSASPRKIPLNRTPPRRDASPDRLSPDERSPAPRSVSPEGRRADSRSPSPRNSDEFCSGKIVAVWQDDGRVMLSFVADDIFTS
ncbi:hypothetical protein ACLOJK_013306 [Asimina triloba]